MIKWIERVLGLGMIPQSKSVNAWRTQVFKTALQVLAILSIVPFSSGLYLAYQQKSHLVMVFILFLFCSILSVVFTKGVSIKYRIYITVSIIFLFGGSLIVFIGPAAVGSGFCYLIGFSIASAILLGMRAAFNSLFILTGFILLVGLGLHFNILNNVGIGQFNLFHWFSESLNVLVVGALSSIALAVFMRELETTIDKQTSLQSQLEARIEELHRANAKAEEAENLKTNFLGNMGHEIRTPLNSIMGFSELIINDMYSNDEERKKYLKTIHHSGRYLLNIIENVLDFSMIQSKQLKHSIHPVSLNALLADVKDIYLPHNLSNPEVYVIIEPGSLNEHVVNSDGYRLKQVFLNLINNSLKFTTEGAIAAGYAIYENEIFCFVKDTGIGISKENIGKVFERFVKIEGPNEVHGGNGLGLPICKGIIETLGGKMWVESQGGVGTSFYFTIPMS